MLLGTCKYSVSFRLFSDVQTTNLENSVWEKKHRQRDVVLSSCQSCAAVREGF